MMIIAQMSVVMLGSSHQPWHILQSCARIRSRRSSSKVQMKPKMIWK